MTQKAWEKELEKHLAALPKAERAEAISYYRELYGDKLEAGYSNEDILREFGYPEDCAERILAENTPSSQRKRTPAPHVKVNYSVTGLVGIFFLTVLLILPLASIALALIASFGAVCLSSIACALAGILFTVCSPFLVPTSFFSVLTAMGAGICAVGVGVILSAVCFFATKYLAIGTWKALTFIYIRRT